LRRNERPVTIFAWKVVNYPVYHLVEKRGPKKEPHVFAALVHSLLALEFSYQTVGKVIGFPGTFAILAAL
jgi:hypothetical protein